MFKFESQEKQIKRMVSLNKISSDLTAIVKDEIEIINHDLKEELHEIEDIYSVKDEIEIIEHELKAELDEFKETDDVTTNSDEIITGGSMCDCSNSCDRTQKC